MQNTEELDNILDCSDENIKKCAELIREGKTVIFPTETVYGIGACALNHDAVKKIYKYKQRPQNNPLIVHISSWNEARMYVDINQQEEKIINLLTKTFCPGPLTFLLKKSKFIPDIVTANSDWVGIRIPGNKVAQKLLEYSMLPIAAPSANISGKITSTDKEHIIDYFDSFKYMDISMLLSDEPCKYGVESTIIKINNTNIQIIRPGIITNDMIKECLKELNSVYISQKLIREQRDAPGTNISHYTTSKNTLMFFCVDIPIPNSGRNGEIKKNIADTLAAYLNISACIDFGKSNIRLKDLFYAYVDLSKDGDINEAIFNLYNVLHQLNKNSAIKNILIFDFCSDEEGLFQTIFDRIFRCCSGKRMMIPINTLEYYYI